MAELNLHDVLLRPLQTEKSVTLMKRRPGALGLYLLIAMILLP